MMNFAALILTFSSIIHCVLAKERVYYIAIREEIWNYAPSGQNLINGVKLVNDSDASVFYKNGPARIGGSYKKAVYRQYEDGTYTKEIPKDPTLGFMGPTLIGEVNDVITIYAKNFASKNFSLHPHGTHYLKESEGAVYVDGTPVEEKIIQPGGSKKYTWDLFPEYGPTSDDPACLTWIYHSHVDTVVDTYSGLVGGILVCLPGTLNDEGKRTDVDLNYLLMFFVVNENLSWYIDDNIQQFCTDPMSVNKSDEDFQESNQMHGINGLGYGNLEGLAACEGNTIAWNIFGLGNEVDIHSAHFERQTVISYRHRQDTVRLFPAVFKAVQMKADNPGSSLIACQVNDHYIAGMLTKFHVNSTCGAASNTGAINPTKKLYIGIVEGNWNYGPSGLNLLTGANLTEPGSDSATFFERGATRIGGTYKKAMFVEYQDEDFTILATKDSSKGLLGPLIAVAIGDVIEVTLKNMASVKYNIEPHGLLYDDVSGVQPNNTHTYTWTAPDSVTPTDLDTDCVTYLYTPSVDPMTDTNSGLVGPLLVCKRGTLSDAMSKKAYYLLFSVLDENQSHYLEDNIHTFTTSPSSVDPEDRDFQESNLMHSINGLMYGNLQNIQLCANEQTDFHVIGLGTEVDMHSMFVTGVNIQIRRENTAVASVFPHTTASLTVTPESTGIGQIKCFVIDHLVGGMLTTYNVTDCGASATGQTMGRTLTYFIGVVEENWDYATKKRVDIFGRSLDDPRTPGYVYAHQQNGSRIGSVYKKALYQQYTDNTFTKKMEKSSDLGILGPVISAEEGDVITIVFKNMATSLSYSMVSWGAKDSEDPFNSKTGGVKPGNTKTYEWTVPSSAVPQADQPGCASWVYGSNVDETKDVYSGLIGPLLLCRTGSLSSDGRTANFDKDFFLLFTIFDENNSHYLNDNIQTFAKADPSTFNTKDVDFVESNLMHSINGIIYENGRLVTNAGDKVLWHLIGYGNEVDIHTVHFHAHAYSHVTDVTSHSDVFSLFPGKIGTVTMQTDEPGVWLLHCHVDDHLEAGMIGTYTVNEPETTSNSLEVWQLALMCVGAVLAVVLVTGFSWWLRTRKEAVESGTPHSAGHPDPECESRSALLTSTNSARTNS